MGHQGRPQITQILMKSKKATHPQMVPVLRESDPLTAPMVDLCWWEPIKEFHFLGHIIYKWWAHDLSVWTSKSLLVSVRPGVLSLLLGCESNSLELQSLQKLNLWPPKNQLQGKAAIQKAERKHQKKLLELLQSLPTSAVLVMWPVNTLYRSR